MNEGFQQAIESAGNSVEEQKEAPVEDDDDEYAQLALQLQQEIDAEPQTAVIAAPPTDPYLEEVHLLGDTQPKTAPKVVLTNVEDDMYAQLVNQMQAEIDSQN